MFKFVSAFLVTLFAAGTLMAQDIPLPGPGGPDDRPVPPPPQANRPPVPPPPSSGPLDPFPGQPLPPATPAPSTEARVLDLGHVNLSRQPLNYTFYFDPTYDVTEIVGVANTGGTMQVNAITMYFRDGRGPMTQPGMLGTYPPGKGMMWMFLANNVSSVVVNANAVGSRPASFRLDAKVFRSTSSY